MQTQLLNRYRIRFGRLNSDDSFGFTGAFLIPLEYRKSNGKVEKEWVKVIASDSRDDLELPKWRHVSVSLKDHPDTCPRWEIMAAVKDLFWDPETVVMQLHVAKSNHISNANALHLWEPLEAKIPTPPNIMVGVPGGQLDSRKLRERWVKEKLGQLK